MAYNGYLLRCNNVTLQNRFISLSSYSVTYQTLDLDSYRDANGQLHRTALSHKVVKIEFTTPYLRQKDIDELSAFLQTVAGNVEKKTTANFYNPETNSYLTQSVYIPDITFKIAQNSPSGFIYEPTRIAFIGY